MNSFFFSDLICSVELCHQDLNAHTSRKLTRVFSPYQVAIELGSQDRWTSQVARRTAKLVLDILFGEARQLSRLGGLPRTKASEQALLCGNVKTVYFRRLLARIDLACS
jgi:hypothetical protein